MTNLLYTIDNTQFVIGNLELPIDCFRCGICCERYQPAVRPNEITSIAKFLEISEDEFIEKYVQRVPLKERFVIRRTETGCAFLSFEDNYGKAKCTIYDVRPYACRDWQASLSRAECQQGFRKLKAQDAILTPHAIYSSKEAINKLIEAVTKDTVKKVFTNSQFKHF